MQNQIDEGLRGHFRVAQTDGVYTADCQYCTHKVKKTPEHRTGKLYFHTANLVTHLSRRHTDVEVIRIKKRARHSPQQSTLTSAFKPLPPVVTDKVNITISVSVNEIKSYAAEAVSTNGLPLSVFEKSGLQKMLRPILEKLHLSLNRHSIRDLVISNAKEFRSELSKELSDRLLCLKFDIASKKERGFLGINVQYVCDGKLKVKTLTVMELFQSHTAEETKECIELTLKKYNVKTVQIYANTTDNAGNMLKCTKLMDKDVSLQLLKLR